MITLRIHITGQVQGVGFRPMVYQVAQSLGVRGWISNASDGVHIEASASEATVRQFYQRILESPPPLALITEHKCEVVAPTLFDNFVIRESTHQGAVNLLLSPDFALCESCRAELYDAQSRRFGYPFTTCTLCGPRYSITRRLPYDRPHTTMSALEMCEQCQAEYHDFTDRRYYAQTISCADCAISMQLFGNNTGFGSQLNDERWLMSRVRWAWQRGEVVAIKGIGGYLLTCDATNADALRRLRERKHRPTKPFAVMYPSVEALVQDLDLSPEALGWLQSPQSPIVLLNTHASLRSGLQKELVAPKLRQLGVMLPYTPLFELLLRPFGKPIVATSANLSNSPIIFDDQKALHELKSVADWVLTNNRAIEIPQDDSVAALALDQTPIWLRRSRGFAPSFVLPALKVPALPVLATGADLKSTFTLTHQRNVYVSQYLGDMESFDTQQHYRQTLQHLTNLLEVSPSVVVVDKHPRYFSTTLGREMATSAQIPLVEVQHHQAHFAAVLAENDLLRAPQPVMGVIWDGTGYGDDGQIWGGEFFIYETMRFRRVSHLSYFPVILGDKMPRQPRLSCLAVCHNVPSAKMFWENKFSDTERELYGRLLTKISSSTQGGWTSSMGRLFDAVASLLGLADFVSYEGEAALLLENSAWEYVSTYGYNIGEHYFNEDSFVRPSTQALIEGIVEDLLSGCSQAFIAAKFHYSLVVLIGHLAQSYSINQIAFSGGVFQNVLLVNMLRQVMSADTHLYFHRQLSPNDESVSFGQMILYTLSK